MQRGEGRGGRGEGRCTKMLTVTVYIKVEEIHFTKDSYEYISSCPLLPFFYLNSLCGKSVLHD